MDGYRFSTEVVVRFAETDAQGIAHHASFVVWLEVARIAYLAEHELLRGASVTVDSDATLPIELDGEQPGTTPARFEIVPRALRLRVPA